MRFGKKRPTKQAKFVTPLAARLAASPTLPVLPDSIDSNNAAAAWDPFENTPATGDYNDCTIAAAGHMIQLWTAVNGNTITLSDAEITAAYSHFVGANFKQDLKMQDVLEYWRTAGIGGHTVQAYGKLDNQNADQIKYSVDVLGACYIGFGLPDALFGPGTNPTLVEGGIWGSGNHPPTGDYAPNPGNGHTIAAVGYTDSVLYFITWGNQLQMTWNFFDTYMDEAWGVVSPDWLKSGTAQSPDGYTLTDLGYLLEAIQG